MSKKKTDETRPKPRLGLEMVLVVGLAVKLILLAAFLLFYPGVSDIFFESGQAFAQEDNKDADKGKPAEETKNEEKNNAAKPAPVDEALAKQYESMVAALQSRVDDLNRREKRIKDREAALDILQKELNQRMADLDATRAKLDELVKRHEELVKQQQVLKDARIEHLVKAYKGMRPERAGNLINSLDEDVAVELLSAMPGRNAGQILAFVEPEKAARITKSISERRPKQENPGMEKIPEENPGEPPIRNPSAGDPRSQPQ